MATWTGDELGAGFNLVNAGNVFINSATTNVAGQLIYQAAGVIRWSVAKMDAPNGTSLNIRRFDGSGNFVDDPFSLSAGNGDLTMNANIHINGTTDKALFFKLGGVSRWAWYISSSDATLSLNKYNSSGVLTDYIFYIDGPTGNIGFNKVVSCNFGLSVQGNTSSTGNTNTNGVYQVNGVQIAASNVTNAVSTVGSYADPSWITSLAWTKISGKPTISSYQTPWLSNIDASGFQLGAIGDLAFKNVDGDINTYFDIAAWNNNLIITGASYGTATAQIIFRTAMPNQPYGDNIIIGPQGNLFVRGEIHTIGNLEVGIAGTGDRYSIIDLHSDNTNADYSFRIMRNPGVNGPGQIECRGSGSFSITSQYGPIYFVNGGVNRMVVNNDGNIGIGTDSPSAKLDVNGNIHTNGVFSSSNSTNYIEVQPTRIVYGVTAGTRWHVSLVDAESGGNGGSNIYMTRFSDAGAYLSTPILLARATGNCVFCVDGGNVGIGNFGSTYKLDVTGDINITGNYKINGVNISTGGGGSQTPWTSDIDGGGFKLKNTELVEASYGLLIIPTPPGPVFMDVGAYAPDADAWVWVTANAKLRFATNDTERMLISADGKIGINNSNPNYKLDVSGDINFTGKLYHNGVEINVGETDLTPVLNRLPAALVGGKMDSVVSSLDEPGTELSVVPTTNGSLRDKINYLFQYFRNKRVVTETSQTMYKENGTSVLGRGQVVDDGTSVTINEPS